MDQRFFEYLCGFVTKNKLALFDGYLRERTRQLTVVLEDVYRPHNASACLRSCDAFGIQDVHIIENRYAYRMNPDVELGSARWLTIHRYAATNDNSDDCIDALKQRGYRIVAMCPHGDAQLLEDFDVSQPAALFFGTEAEGLTQTVVDRADVRLRIPIYGFAESLNISVAVAVCLHHLTLQLRRAEIDWHLSEAEKQALKLAWVRRAIGQKRLRTIEREYERRFGTPEGRMSKAK